MSSTPSVRHLLLLVTAVVALSSAVLFIQISTVPPVTLTAWRLFLAGVVLAPLAWKEWERHRRSGGPALPMGVTLLPGVVLALHLITWVVGARRTPTANASLIANMAPVVLPGLLFLFAGERVSKREWTGTGMVLLGLLFLVGGDLHLDRASVPGDLICFVSMLFLALYLALARQRSPRIPGFALYVTPLYLTGAAVCGLVIAAGGGPLWPEPSQWKWVWALALVPTLFGHGLLNHAMKRWRGQVVAVASQTQFIFAGLGAYFLFGTIPQPTFYLASVLALAGALYLVGDRRSHSGKDE